MKWLWITLIIASLAYRAFSQSNEVYLVHHNDGWWILWTNTPAKFKISTSSNMVDWTVWMTKQSGPGLTQMELKVFDTNDVKFLKFEPVK